jgi:hypothetical protein
MLLELVLCLTLYLDFVGQLVVCKICHLCVATQNLIVIAMVHASHLRIFA